MAVNKNFVIKNGIQVNENLLYGDSDQTRVSIGTYVPLHTLHVIGGIGATHAHITGISTFDRNLYVAGGLEVVGVTSLSSAGGMTTTGGSLRIGRGLFVQDGATITGVTTLNNNADFNRNLDVFIQTTTKDLLVTGVGTVTGVGSFGSNVDIAGNLTVNGILLNGGTSIGTDFSTRNLTASGVSTFVGLSTFQNGIFVSGIGTFANDLDINASVDVDGHTELDNLNVSGVSTFVGLSTFQNGIFITGVSTFANNLDINADIDVSNDISVTGNAGIGSLNVSGIATFSNIVNFLGNTSGRDVVFEPTTNRLLFKDNTSAVFGTDTDLTIVHSGANASIQNATGNVQFETPAGRQFTFNRIITIDEGIIVSTGSTFNGEVDINNQVNVSGATTFGSNVEINGHSDIFTLQVGGATTISGHVDINNSVDVAGVSTFQKLVNFEEGAIVVGVSTFSDNLDINASVDIDGHTELDNLNVSGVSTFVGMSTFQDGIYVTGVATFAQDIDIDGSIDIDGHLEVDNLNASGVSTFVGMSTFQNGIYVTGVSTFANDLDINANIDVFGSTELDRLNVSGMSTLAAVDINGGEIGVSTITSQFLNVTGLSTFVGLSTFQNGIYVTGVATFAQDIDIDGSIDVDGHLEVDNLRASGVSTFVGLSTFQNGIYVTGVSTFANDLDINAGVDISNDLSVTGNAGIGSLIVSGISTFTGNIDANGDVDIDGHTELDYVNVSAASTFGKVVDINSGLDITGVSTFSSNLDINANVDISGDVNITGITTVHDLVITGVTTHQDAIVGAAATFTSIGIKTATVGDHELKVIGETELDGSLNVTGLSTFSSPITATSSNFSGIVTAAQFVGFGSQIDGIVAIGTRPYDVGTGINTAPGKLWWNAETGIGNVYYHDPSGDEFWVDFSGQSGGPTSGSINDLIRDTSPQLGGNLDLNGSDIIGAGNIDITGNINFTGSISGTGITAAQVTVDVNPGTATSHHILVSTGATVDGDYSVFADTDFYYTPSTDTLNIVDLASRNVTAGIITATALHGDGSNITGLATTESVNARFLNAGITTISQLRTAGVSTFMGPVGIGTFDEEIIDTNNEFTLTTKGKLRVVGTNPYQPDSLTVISFGTPAYNQTYVRNSNVRGETDEASGTFNVDGSLYPWSTYYYDAGGGNYYVIGRDDTIWKIFTTTVDPTTFVNGTTLSMTSVGALATASITKDGFESPDVADPNVTYSGSTPVGIGTTISLDGNTGIISATTYYGDGSNLTGIAATDNVSTNSLVVSGVSTLGLVTSNSSYVVGVSTIDVASDVFHKGLDILTSQGNINLGVRSDYNRLAFTGAGSTTVVSEIYSTNSFFIIDRPGSGGFAGIKMGGEYNLFAAGNSYTRLNHAGQTRLQTEPGGVVITGIATATNVSVASSVTALSFYGDGANLTGIANTGDINADRLTVVGVVTAATFIGDGSGLSNLTGIGTGVFIQDDDTDVGAATTINFGNYISVSPIEAGITTITGIGTEHVTSDTLVAGIATITTLKVGTAITATNGIVTATSFSGDGSNLTGIAVTANVSANTLVVSGVSTLGVVTATSFYGNGRFLTGISTESVNAQFLNSGITTVRELNVQGSQVFDYSTLTISGISPSNFNGEYTRQTTGFTLDTGDVSSGNALFHADSNYYYYSKVGAASTALIFSNEDNLGGGQWIVFYKDGSDFTEGNVSNNDALGAADSFTGIALTSIQYDNSRESIPGSDNVTYNSSYNIGISTLGIATATSLYVGVVTATSFVGDGSNLTGIAYTANVSTNTLVVSGVSTLGVVTGATYYGDGTNLTGVARTDNIIADTLVVSGVSTVGVVTSGTYYGDGSYLTDGRWTLGANGSVDYTFTGIGFTQTTADPVLFLARGRVYEFVNNMGAHPFRIQSTANGATGTQYDDGVTNNDVSNGTLRFEVPFNAPNTLYYQCTSHAGMGGTITIYPTV